MLEEIRIGGLGVIDDATLELHPGLTVVTGETGAGKTMVVHGLTLLFGGRLDSALVRAGAGHAFVEGRIAVPPGSAAAERAEEAGAALDDGVLVVARTMSAEGRSRCHLGGRSVPVAVLAELAESLVALHGQHEAHRLARPADQRALLDRYAGEPVGGPLGEWESAYARWRAAGTAIEEIASRRRERAREADLLRLGLAEIAAVEPVDGEDATLAAEVARLSHADALRGAATAAHAALAGEPDDLEVADAIGLVGRARQALASAAGHDAALDALGTRLAEVSYLLADLAADLASYADAVDADPDRLAGAQARQAALAGLTRKYGPDVASVLDWARQAEARLAELDGDDDRLDALQAEQAALRATLATTGAALSAARAAAAARLATAVTAELAALAMPDARLVVEVTQRDELGPYGLDDVALLLVPHSGAPPRPVARGASGGELSRVMLALEVVLAAADPVPTMVFDEVDAGVGGRAAVEVGARLARLARTHQVVAVTHLPQVAAFADRHLHVAKSSDGTVTASGVSALDDAGRLRELSRMLAGLEDSALARGHAEELLAAAASAKAAG